MPYRGEADIVLGVFPLSEAPATAEGAWLDEGERARLAAMSGPIRPREFLGGRFLARSMAGRALGAEPSEVRIEVEEKGRPSIAAPERLSLGLTHTRDYAACALSRGSIGLDLEELGRKGELRGVEEIAFTPSERAAVEGLSGPERELPFFVIWTLKEAFLKLKGMGVPEIERAPSFAMGPDGGLRVSGGGECEFLAFSLGSSIIGSLAFGIDGPDAAAGPATIAFDPRFAPAPGMEMRRLYSNARARWA